MLKVKINTFVKISYNNKKQGKYYFDELGPIILTFKFMEPLITSLIGQIDTANILEFFTIESVYDSKFELLVILLVEKEDLFPVEADLVLNGYLNIVEVTHFPLKGRQCILQIKRRPWKLRGDNLETKNFHNTYDYSIEGTKVTKEFSAFLKEFY